MIIRQFSTGVIVIGVGAALLAGCSRSPRVSFYTLGDAAVTASVNPSKSPPSVSLVKVTLPELVDRPQMVERFGDNRVEFLESHRWAEPLKVGIARLLGQSLGNQIGSDRVTAYPQTSAGDPDFRVSVDIQQFEALEDSISLDAIWTIRRTVAGISKTGRSRVREPRGGGYEALVAAYNRAIVSLGKEMAQTIISDWAGR